MKNIMKKVIKLAFVAAFVAVAGYGVYTNQTSDAMSDLALANVEALARYELPEVEITCGSNGGACWAIFGDCWVTAGAHYPDCYFCGYTSSSCISPCL